VFQASFNAEEEHGELDSVLDTAKSEGIRQRCSKNTNPQTSNCERKSMRWVALSVGMS